MKYYEVTFTLSPLREEYCDILSALTADCGFESFVPDGHGLTAYVQQHEFDETALQAVLSGFPVSDVDITYTVKEAEDKDWNLEWEQSGFEPIAIGKEVVVHATGHTDVPDAALHIRINPQLAFGTGSHQTTYQMMRHLLRTDLTGKSFLDAGCGTGLLAILAALRGARPVTAYDIDDWSVRNTLDNMSLNGVEGAEVLEGNASVLEGKGPFDVIAANINRNILLNDLPAFVRVLAPQGSLFISGFYTADVPVLEARAAELGLYTADRDSIDDWASLQLIRRN